MKDLEIFDGTPIMIELKEDGDDAVEDENQGEDNQDNSEAVLDKHKDESIDLDSTPNLRTALVEKGWEAGVEIMQVDILKMTIRDLTNKICKDFFLKEPHRLLNLTSGKYYTKEDENKLLHEFE